MKAITVDIPLEAISGYVLPPRLLDSAAMIRFLRLDSNGFLFTCRIEEEEDLKEIRNVIRSFYEHVHISRVGIGSDGDVIIRVSGTWWHDLEPRGKSSTTAYSKFKALEKCQCYFMRSPEVHDKRLRISLTGSPKDIRDLQKTFKSIDVPYKVAMLSDVKEGDFTPLGQLTATQARVLRLAYAQGYYDVPRRTSTDDLAGMLQMDKGTVGRHLRRAERNLLNSILT